MWGPVLVSRQESEAGKASEMGGRTQDWSEEEEEEAGLASLGPGASPPSPAPLFPRTRRELKRDVQRKFPCRQSLPHKLVVGEWPPVAATAR